MQKILFILWMLSCCIFLSCQQKPTQESITTNAATAKPSAFMHELKAAKPGAPVGLASANLVVINLNKTTRVDIFLNVKAITGAMHVDVKPSEGLQLIKVMTAQDFKLDTNGKYNLSVDLLAVNRGRYYLNLQAQINDGESVSSRSLAVIIQVGSPVDDNQKSEKTLKQTTNENIISLPAQESISSQ
jgi:hypothetical protein